MAKQKSRLAAMREWVNGLLNETMFRSEGEPTRFYKFLHFWVLVGKSFVRNRCPLRASALSYTTLLALIPMLAVAMSVTTSLLKKEGKDQIEHFIEVFVSKMVPPATETNAAPASLPITTNLPPDFVQSGGPTNSNPSDLIASPTNSIATTNQSANIVQNTNTVVATERQSPDSVSENEARLSAAQKRVADQIYGFVQNVQSGAIAGVGMLFLIYAAIRMLSQVESTFNDIWGVTRGRGWWMSIVLYWTTITLGPLLLVGAVGLASGPYFETTQKFLLRMPGIGAFVFKLLPLFLLWLLFALFYKAVPNTKVHFTAALIGGLVGGTAWQVNNWLGFLYVSRVVTYSKMYGGLGLVPVFMLGLYLSWLILLFGAQVAYAFQNRALYLQERLAENVNQRGREFVALRLMTCIGQRFQRGLPAPGVPEMSSELGIPTRLSQQVLQTLIAAHLVKEISGAEAAYTPGRPLESINAHHILQAMRATQGQELMTRDEPVRQEVYGEFARIQEAEKRAASSITMLALVNRADARKELAPPASLEKEEIQLSPALVPKQSESLPEKTTERREPENIQSPLPAEAVEPAPEAEREVSIEKSEPEEERDFPL